MSVDPERRPAVQPDRSLLYIGVGIVVLVAAATIAVLLVESRQARSFDIATPEGVVQHHLAAYEDGDYDAAWASFSSDVQSMMPLDEYRRAARDFGSYSNLGSRRILFDATEIDGARARVRLTVEEYYEGGPFGGGDMFRSSRDITLVREAGQWLIDDPLIGLEPGPFEPI